MFNNTFAGKKVFVTGHTGFKGSWLTTWLIELGAEVHGYSDGVPTAPSAFDALKLSNKITETRGDVCDLEHLRESLNAFKPDFIFHLAAQALVSVSYKNPIQTISTNVIGVANMLEVVKNIDHKCTAIIITSDKCYENVEWEWGYKETDSLGGKDIYSGSKGAAEVIFHAYYESFFRDHEHVNIVSARAGNVIGGGDWAKDRIIADCVRAWTQGNSVEVRSPNATRPWQHVLEPLSGYLALGAKLWSQDDSSLSGESFNFGPLADRNRTVIDVIDNLSKHWNSANKLHRYYAVTDNINFHEAGLLKLNCDKAVFHLNWQPTLDFKECMDFVGCWYDQYYNSKNSDMFTMTINQIKDYCAKARKANVFWSN